MPKKGGRRKKRRTHVVPAGTPVPRSLVLRRGPVDPSVRELLGDLRLMMMPHTAPRLRASNSNPLRDFLDVAGPLGVTHLLLVSQSDTNVALRIGCTPRGPTLTFRVEGYTLGRQVRAASRRPPDVKGVFEVPPLIVLHNFVGVAAEAPRPAGAAGVPLADALKLAMATFQHMFPPIDPAAVALGECRRVVLAHFSKATRLVELRQYVVRAEPVGVTRGVKKVAGGGGRLPDLSRCGDVAEFVLSGGRAGGGAGAASDSEHEGDEAARVVLPAAFRGRGNAAQQQSTIRLAEIGPRLSLRLLKVEQGLCGGEVLYHSFQSRTAGEAAELRARAASRERERSERREEQGVNVARKKAAADDKAAAKKARRDAKQAAAAVAAAAGTLGEGDGGGEEEEGGGEEEEGGEEEDEEGEDEEDEEDDEDEDDDVGDGGSDDEGVGAPQPPPPRVAAKVAGVGSAGMLLGKRRR